MPAEPVKLRKLKPMGFQFMQQLPIAAKPAKVWKTLLDIPGWFRFDPTARRTGKIEPWVGGRFYAEHPDGATMLHAVVMRMDPERLLRLAGPMGMSHLPVNNVFIFELTPNKHGTLLKLCQRTYGYMDADVQKRYKTGWKQLLGQLKAMVEGNKK